MRPVPPSDILDDPAPRFVPAPELIDWARSSFIDDDAEHRNDDHQHLRFALLGALWTNVPNGRNGRRVLGQCEMGLPPAGKWQRARIEAQLISWFGLVPTFLLTFDAAYCLKCSDAEFMALVEHELYHCGQALDEWGAPRFNKRTGEPVWALRGHDVEEFVGIVRRYGADAAGVAELVDAANAGAEIAPIRIAQCCGTCQLRAA